MKLIDNFYVYKHVRLDNNKTFYIGKGVKYRAYDKVNRNEYWKRIVNKYGYKIIIVKYNLTEEEAYVLENQMILLFKKYNRAEANLNTDFGIGGRMGRSDESYKIMGQNLYKNRNRSYKGENNPMYGKTFSEEHKKKISEGNKGKILGLIRPESTRKKMSMNHINNKKVINIETNEIYYSIQDAANKNNFNRNKIVKQVYNMLKKPSTFKFLE